MITAIQNGSLYEIRFNYDPALVELVKSVPGRWYHPEGKYWSIPLDKLGFFQSRLANTSYYSQLKITSQEAIAQNDTIDFTEEIQIPDIDISAIELYVKEGCNLYNHQKDTLKFEIDRKQRGLKTGFILADQPGLGKAVTLDTPIPTPNGWKAMKDICVGDQVFDENGDPTTVTAIYEHDNLEMYKITFQDGAEITCCKDHLWQFYANNRYESNLKVWTTEQIINGSNYGPNKHKDPDHMNRRISNYILPKHQPVKYNHSELPIDPWLLGFILGDGGLSNGAVNITTSYPELVEAVKHHLPESCELHHTSDPITYTICRAPYDPRNAKENPMVQIMRSLGLLGHKSKDKFIPRTYLEASIEDRWALLQGLMDSDGYADKRNGHSYSTSSIQLKDDFVELLSSLGGYADVKVIHPKLNGKEYGESYDIRVKVDDPSLLYRYSEFKKARASKRHFTPTRKFKSIEYVGKMAGKCITVDSPSHLYLCTKYFIVTHNTLQIINLALYNKNHEHAKHCLIVACINSAKHNWVTDIEKHTNGEYEGYLLGSRLNKKGELKPTQSGEDKYIDLATGFKYGNEEAGPLPYFLIVNIEAFRYKDKNAKKNKDAFTCELIHQIEEGNISMIALDEIHRNASPTSQQGKEVMKVKKAIQDNCDIEWVPMTGTPIVNNPLDVFLPLKLVNGHRCNSYYEWSREFCVYGGYGGHEVISYKNIPKLKALLQPNMLRRKREDVLDLPPKIEMIEYVENSDYQNKLYAKILAEMNQEKDKIRVSLNPMTAFLRLRQINGAPEIVDPSIQIDSKYLSKNGKIKRALELIDEIIANGEKVVVFSNWVETLKAIYKLLEMKKIKTCVYTGSMNQDVREKHKEVFLNNPEYHVILGTIGALGTSHTLTAATNEIFLDEPWSPAVKDQAMDRIYRIGTTQSVTIYTLLCQGTVDDKVHDILFKKQGSSDFIVDNMNDALKNHPEMLDWLLS